MKLFTNIFILALSLNSAILFAQDVKKGEIIGVVSEANTPKTLEGVTVELVNPVTKVKRSTTSDAGGNFAFTEVTAGLYNIEGTLVGFEKFQKTGVKITDGTVVEVNLAMVINAPVVVEELDHEEYGEYEKVKKSCDMSAPTSSGTYNRGNGTTNYYEEPSNTEGYAPINENEFRAVAASPLSTFSVDVDAASYSNVRRFLLGGSKPERDAVRVEEMINYFDYDYPNPTEEYPFSITTELGKCPWNENHQLVHIGLQGKKLEAKNLPPSNLVFLLDVSGSMSAENKLPLLKKSLELLVNELGEKDRIAIVVYAGAAGLVLESTSAGNKTKIIESMDALSAGGSTAGGAGIELAYNVAAENFIEGGNNRVILATDGDFNVGMSSDASMAELIEKKRETGIFLTCLGYGMGNYQDSKLETLADKGNGNYAYIDNLMEAKKVLVNEIGATLLTIAKDVKIQVEFNPAVVESYRLVGYENRLLNAEDFNDDKKDAGEIGAGHTVTALYEVVLKGDGAAPSVDDLRYGNNESEPKLEGELLNVKFRYKELTGEESKLISRQLTKNVETNNSDNFDFAAAVAEFGMILRDSEFKGTATIADVLVLAQNSIGADVYGYRAEFIQLVKLADEVYANK